MTNICNLSHGLPYTLFWPHKTEICSFIQRLSQQKHNFDLIEKATIQGKTIRESVNIQVFGKQSKIFHHKQNIKHQDISKLVDKAIKKMKTRNSPKRNWNVQEICILIWIVFQFQYFYETQFYNLSSEIWEIISSYVPGKTSHQCLFKTLKSEKIMLSTYPWRKQEETILEELVRGSGEKDWNKISQDLYFRSNTPKIYRLPKQCREHWSSYLIYELKKGPWEIHEDIELLENVRRVGKKWTEISKKLSGRTQNAIKNRCNLLLDKFNGVFQDVEIGMGFDRIIQKIKEQYVKKVNKKEERKLKSKNSTKQFREMPESNNQKQEQMLIKQEGQYQQQQQMEQQSFHEVQQIQCDKMVFIRPTKESNLFQISDKQTNKHPQIRTLTNIQRNIMSLQQIQNIQIDLFPSEDISNFLFIEQYHIDQLESFSFGNYFHQ